jgi:hypothetical protein
MFKIYHIPTFVHKNGKIGKIGCTNTSDAKHRVTEQGYTNYEILETHTDIYEASDREIELQIQYGYPVDKIHYWKTIKMATTEDRSKGGKIGGKTQGRKNVESGHLDRIREKRSSSCIAIRLADNTHIEYSSQNEAGRELGIDLGNINKVLRGRLKTAKGYKFEYKL